MVFRKIEDENAKYGVRLQNRPLDFIKGIRNETGSTQFNDGFKESLQQDEQALINYQQAILNGQNKTAAFNNTMKAASAEAQSYAQSLKLITNGTTQEFDKNSISNFTTQQKIAEVGHIASDHSWKNSIQLINEYNSGLKTQGNICKETGLSQQQLTQGIGQGNAVMGNYLGTLNGAEAKMGGYVKSLITAKAASIGLQIASTAMNMAITMGVSLAIQGIITLADKLIVTSKEAIKAGEEAQQAIGEIQKTYTDKVELVSNSTDRFIELLKGVNEEGQNVSLSTDDYNEFLDISNQLADAFPTLTRTYDENGNAIVHLNGDAQSINTTLQQLLETERELSNQKITENLDDVFNGFKTKAKQNENQLQNAENRLKSYQSIVDMLSSDASNSLSVGSSYSLTGLNPEHAQKLLDIFDKYFHTYYDMGDGNGDTTLTIIPDEYNEQALKDHYDEIKKEIDNTYGDFANYYAAKANESSAEIKEINNKQKSEWSQLAKDMIVWVQTTSQYQEYSDSQRNAIQKLIDNFDYQNFKFDNLEDFKNFLTDKLMTVFDDEETSNQITAFLDIKTKFNDNEVSVADFKNQVDSLNKYLDDNITDEEVRTQIKFSLGIDGSESATISQQVDDIISDLGKDSDAKFKKWINSLNSSEFEIVKELKLDTDAATWTLDEWKQKVEGEATIRATLDFKIADSKADIEKISTAATESNSATGLSDDSIYNIKNIFGEIEDYNESKIFEQTANGIKLNTDELHRLQDAQVDIQKKKFDKSLKILDGQYDNLTESLTECSKQLEDYSTLSEKDRQKLIEKSDSLIKQRNAVVDNISAISALSSQYSALTSAYNEWLSAKDGSEDGDTYDTIRSGLKDIQELYEKGLVGTNEFESYMKLITGTDYSNASIDTITEAYKNLSKEIGNTGYSVKDFLKADQQGVENFLNAASKIKDSGITENDGVWDIQIKDTEQLAENLHISEEFLEAMLLKLRDYKFDINFDDEVSEKYKKLSEYAEKANEELIKSGKVKTAFNFNSQSIEEAQSQIDTFFKELEDDKGKIHLDSTEASNAVKVLEALQSKRDQLNKPAILAVNTDSIKDADADLADGIDLVQQFANASRELNNLNEKKKIDATIDTTEAQKKVQNLASKLQKLGSTETGAKLSLNDTAVQTTLNNIKNTKISPKVSISQTDLDTINAKIAAINPEDVKIGSDSSDLESDVQKAKTLLDEIKDKKIKIDVNGNATNTLSDILDKQSKVKNKEVTYTITYKEKKQKASVDGTANYNGSAFHNGTSGDWRVGFNGVSLGGELGEELLVRNGHWYTIGKDSAEFFKHQRNDIIFNANQTKELFKYGKVGGGRPRGRVYNGGTAKATGTAFAKVSGGGKFKTNPALPKNNTSNVKQSYYDSKDQESSDSKSREIIDYIEIKISRMERKVKNIDSFVTGIFKSFNTRLPKVKEEITAITDEIGVQKLARDRYFWEASQYANKAGLSDYIRKSVKNGTINLSDYSQETAEHIKKYQELYEKALDASDAILELQSDVAALYSTKADIISAKYSGGINRAQVKQSLLSTYSDRAEIFGYQGSEKYNNYQYNLEKAIRTSKENERTELQKNLQAALKSGYMSQNSEQYNEMQAQIDQLSEEIAECTNNMYEFEYANRQLKWDRWDYYADAVAKVADEAEWLVEILSDSKLTDDNGAFTNEGMATLGLHGISYNVNMEEAATYGREIARLNKEINSSTKNKSDTNLIARRDELLTKQREYISAAQKEKQAIKSLVEEGINAELDALDKLIDKYTEALDSQKDLYDYQKNVKKQTQDIASLQKQLMVYSQNESDEGKLKTQQLKKSLKEAQESLQETEYDRFITEQKKILEQVYKDYEETLNKKLDDTDALIEEVISTINDNSSGINDTLSVLAVSLGYATTDELKAIISSNGDMVKTYNGEKQDAWGQYIAKASDHYTAVEKAIGLIGEDIKAQFAEWDRYADKNATTVKGYAGVTANAKGDRYIDHSQLSWTQERGVGEVIVRPSDNAILTPLKAGDSVLNGLATNNLFDFTNNPSAFIRNHLSSGVGANIVPLIGGNQSIENHIDLDVTLPNVQNYEQFLTQMQNDRNFQKLMEAIVAGSILKTGNHNKYKINF